MIEKFWLVAGPVALTASGTTLGKLTLTSTSGFKVKQRVFLTHPTAPNVRLEVKRVNDTTTLEVGDIDSNIRDRTDVSAYDSLGTFSAIRQPRPSIPLKDIERATYEEEPTVAKRAILVDEFGRFFDTDNPLQVQLSDGSINIGTVNAELEVQLSHQDDVPDAGDVADSVRVGDGTDLLAINTDGSINPTDWLIQVQRGLVPGVTAVIKFGENQAVTVSGEDIWNNPDMVSDYPFPTAAVTVDFNSSSAADTLLGTGARTVEIFGLDTNFDPQSETINLNGVTQVSSVNTYTRIFRMIVRTAGTGGENAGVIRAENQSTGEAIAAIEINENQTNMAVFTIPNNKTGFLLRIWFSAEANRAPEVDLRVRPLGEVFQIKHHINGASGHVNSMFRAPIILLAKSDLKLMGQASAGTLHIAAGFDLVLVDN